MVSKNLSVCFLSQTLTPIISELAEQNGLKKFRTSMAKTHVSIFLFVFNKVPFILQSCPFLQVTKQNKTDRLVTNLWFLFPPSSTSLNKLFDIGVFDFHDEICYLYTCLARRWILFISITKKYFKSILTLVITCLFFFLISR